MKYHTAFEKYLLTKPRYTWFGFKLDTRYFVWRNLTYPLTRKLIGIRAFIQFQFCKHELRAVLGDDKGWHE